MTWRHSGHQLPLPFSTSAPHVAEYSPLSSPEPPSGIGRGGDLIGVRVLDHIVIGKGRYVSFVDDGYW